MGETPGDWSSGQSRQTKLPVLLLREYTLSSTFPLVKKLNTNPCFFSASVRSGITVHSQKMDKLFVLLCTIMDNRIRPNFTFEQGLGAPVIIIMTPHNGQLRPTSSEGSLLLSGNSLWYGHLDNWGNAAKCGFRKSYRINYVLLISVFRC